MTLAHSPYVEQILGAAPRLLSAIDREPLSLTYGSFDREHWAWKFRDWPRGMLQNAIYPAALLWKLALPGSPYFANDRLREWIHAAIRTMLDRQRANGAVDAFAPNDQDPGVTLFAVHNLSEAVLLLGDHLDPALRTRTLDGLRRGCAFSMHRDESHGFVSNHWALFALAYRSAADLLGDASLQKKAEAIVDRIISEQSSEGWYREYEGPDPGYESLGIFYLAMYFARARCPKVLESLRRSVHFYSHFVHPDGSVGGAYGSRYTSLYFPGGFEILTPEIPPANAVARFMSEKLRLGNVVTPLLADAENLSPLLASYGEAAARYAGDARLPVASLPFQALSGVQDFPESGLSVAGRTRYFAVWNGRKGGVNRVFDKRSGELVHEDAGYCVQAAGRRWVSQTIGLSQSVKSSEGDERTSEGAFAEYLQPIPTPLNFLALRVANLTLFRSAWMGQWIRNWIVGRLILTKRKGPFLFRRTVAFGAEKVTFSDRIVRSGDETADQVSCVRSLTGIHMGSAKYFHASELREFNPPDTREMTGQLNRDRRADCSFEVNFSSDAAARVTGASVEPAEVQLASRGTKMEGR